MAFNDPFLFATDSELWPIYYEDDGLFSPEFDLFSDPIMDSNPIHVPAVDQPKLVEHVNPLPSHKSSSALLTDSDSTFTNPQHLPFMDNNWEQPLTWAVPASQVPLHVASVPSIPAAPSQYDDELVGLALNEPEIHQQPTQNYHYYAPTAPAANVMCNQSMFYGTQPQPQSTFKASKRRVIDDEDDMEDSMAWDTDPVDFGEDEDPTEGFKLPASKSPIMEAMVVCALNGWGIDIITNNPATSTSPAEVIFRVTDFNRYYKISRAICSKQRPTDDLGSRIKSLRRWFVNFPKKKDRCENAFNLIVKPSIAKKVNEIIIRNSKNLGLTKRRRRM